MCKEKAALPSPSHRGPWSSPAAPLAEGPWLICLAVSGAWLDGLVVIQGLMVDLGEAVVGGAEVKGPFLFICLFA